MLQLILVNGLFNAIHKICFTARSSRSNDILHILARQIWDRESRLEHFVSRRAGKLVLQARGNRVEKGGKGFHKIWEAQPNKSTKLKLVSWQLKIL